MKWTKEKYWKKKYNPLEKKKHAIMLTKYEIEAFDWLKLFFCFVNINMDWYKKNI